MIKISTDKAYLLGLIIGGGIIHGDMLQIVLPYKNWGDEKINPSRAGGIAEDILKRLNPLFKINYHMAVSYTLGTDWKIITNQLSTELVSDLHSLGLPDKGELRYIAHLTNLIPHLKTHEHKKNFITGLVDTIGSLAPSHRRFTDDFQIISFEFKGNNFRLVSEVINILKSIGCNPDQVLWNHPNQHSGICRYYKSWKKGFKVRVVLDDYMLKGGFLFKSKQLSASENRKLQKSDQNTSMNKPVKINGRVTLHVDENSTWLPEEIRGGHYIHNMHFNSVLNIKTPETFKVEGFIKKFEEYFCPFTCLTKGTLKDIEKIISNEDYLNRTKFRSHNTNVIDFLNKHEENATALLFGIGDEDGFPVSYILQGIAYIIAASTGNCKGKRVVGSYIDLLKKYQNEDFSININIPDRGTCLFLNNNTHGALVGYVNNQFNKKLINKIERAKVFIKEPSFEDCIEI